MTAFSETLNSGQGTLGRLVHDDDLYQQIHRWWPTPKTGQSAGPIVDDVRMFTDKIAREPGQLGIRGALDKRPSGLKTGVNW